MKLLQPQEVEVHYIIPAIRQEFATELKTLGRSQKEIAGLLGVTESAISQYLSEKRGRRVDFPEDIVRAIKKAAARITGTGTMIQETQAIISIMKERRFLCSLHGQLEGGIPEGCDVCFR